MAYDKDKNYQAIIDEAVAKGDYKAAAQAEQARNAKIADLNTAGTNKWNATATNKYQGWLDDTDYSTIGRQQMDSGASADEVLKTYNARLAKASGTVGLEKYANDAFQQEMLDYILNYKAEPSFDYNQYIAQNAKPTYTSQYSDQIDRMLDEILNREDFSYDAASDPLYQQYARMYQREGDRAMRDTMAEAASAAGGMNSYAVTAAQQANNYYASQLNDTIPELYQLAYEMYLQDKASDVENLGILNSMDDRQYARYRDTMSDWMNDRDFAYGKYRDDVADYQWDTSFDYGKEQDEIHNNQWQQSFDETVKQNEIGNNQWQQSFDETVKQNEIGNNQWQQQFDETVKQNAIGNNQWQQQFDESKRQNDISNSQWQQSFNESVRQHNIANRTRNTGSSGTKPESDDILGTIMGMTDPAQVQAYLLNSGEAQWRVNEYYNMWLNAQGNKAPTSGSGSGNGNDGNDGNGDNGDDLEITNAHSESRVHVQGYGWLSYQELQKYVDSGKIQETIKNGKVTYKKVS